mgnify:CR=1 FL=1
MYTGPRLRYFRPGRSKEFPGVIDHVSGAIQDKRWADKITYARALWCLVDLDDEKAALEALEPIYIQHCTDPEILALYVHVTPEQLTLAATISLVDRIIANTRRESYKLQYSILKGIKYFLLCQPEDGSRIIETSIDPQKSVN